MQVQNYAGSIFDQEVQINSKYSKVRKKTQSVSAFRVHLLWLCFNQKISILSCIFNFDEWWIHLFGKCVWCNHLRRPHAARNQALGLNELELNWWAAPGLAALFDGNRRATQLALHHFYQPMNERPSEWMMDTNQTKIKQPCIREYHSRWYTTKPCSAAFIKKLYFVLYTLHLIIMETCV